MPADSVAPAAPGDSPRVGWSRRLLSFAIAALIAMGTLLGAVTPAHAGSHGVGYDSDSGWLGSYLSDSDGRQTYCLELSTAPPFSNETGHETVTSLDSLSRQQLAELNYVLAKWGQSGDPSITAAVALYVWSVADAGVYNSHGMSGDAYYVARAPSGVRSTILSHLATMRAEAPVYAVTDPSLSLSVAMSGQYSGTLTVSAHPAHLQGTATLTDAVFADGSTSRTLGVAQFGITGTPADGAPWYQIGASMSVTAEGYGAKVDVYRFGAGEQRTVASVAGAGGRLSATAETPRIDLDFQPVIGTQVAARFVAEGDAFVDELEVSVTKGTWTIRDGARIPVEATGTLYGPFDEQPAESDTPPLGAPVARQTLWQGC